MKTRFIAMLMAVMLLAGLLSGCNKEVAPATEAPASEDPTTETPANEDPATEAPVTEAPAELPDLETLYNQGMDVLAQYGDNAPILFPEFSLDYLNEFYPGIAEIPMKQFYAGVAPVTNAPFEVILVEVENAGDVQTLIDIFQDRADIASQDTTYPDNAAAWANQCKITSRGNYVFLAVMMGSIEIPAEFILD